MVIFYFANILLLCTSQDIQQLTGTAGNDVTLSCTSTKDYPTWIGPEIYNGYTQQYNNNGQSSFPNPNVPEQKRLRLGWGSDKSSLIIRDAILSDRGLYHCSLFKINLSIRVTPRSPMISNTEISADDTLVIRKSESQETSLVCISSGGYPKPLVQWYRGTTGTQPLTSSSSVSTGDNSYNVTQTYTFSPQRQDDGVKYICQSSFQKAPRHITTSSVEIFLYLKPNPPTAVQTLPVSAGHQVTLRCTTIGSRPAASIIWSYRNTEHTGEQTSTLDDITKTYAVVSLLKLQVSAEDNDQTVQCKVSHDLLITPAQLTASINLKVAYPPTVSVNATNTTVKEPNAILSCIAKGNPDGSYSYGKWIQRWPGYDVPVLERPGSETLELTALTYEHSGYYTCTASNGIKIFGTNTEFVEGTAVQLLVKSYPVIVSLDAKIASKLNKNKSVEVEYFSNIAGSDVKLYKIVNGEIKAVTLFSVTKKLVEIEVPVFSHLIKEKGTRSDFTIKIKSEEDYGFYYVVVSNIIGSSNKSFEIIPTKPPVSPSDFTIDSIQHNKARISWMRGYNGGLTQTFVIQLGTDEKWSDVEVFDRNTEDKDRISKILTDLFDSTTYFVRLYAYNEEGNSPLSETLNFTTSPIKVKTTFEINNTAMIIIGTVLGLIIVALLVFSIYMIVQRRRELTRNKDFSRNTSSRRYVNVDGSKTLQTKGVKLKNASHDVQTSESQYTELDKDLKEAESAYDAISTM